MTKMFKGCNIIDFFQTFPDDDSCKLYLADLKWRKGFNCKKCSNTSWCKTKKIGVRKCNKCKHKESSTASTMFHKVKFPLQKAFYIAFIMSTSKKSSSANEFARKLGIHYDTAWLFTHKVRRSMISSKQYPIKTKVVVDEFVIGGPEKGKRGRSKGKKKEVVMAIEYNGFGILRTYCRKISGAGTKELRPLFDDHIDTEAEIKTDGWRGYKPLIKSYKKLTQTLSNKGENFPLIHRQIMMLKGWLRGTHHHCKYLQPYLDEYCYRFNRLRHMNTLFNNLMVRMVTTAKTPKSELIKYWGN